MLSSSLGLPGLGGTAGLMTVIGMSVCTGEGTWSEVDFVACGDGTKFVPGPLPSPPHLPFSSSSSFFPAVLAMIWYRLVSRSACRRVSGLLALPLHRSDLAFFSLVTSPLLV